MWNALQMWALVWNVIQLAICILWYHVSIDHKPLYCIYVLYHQSQTFLSFFSFLFFNESSQLDRLPTLQSLYQPHIVPEWIKTPLWQPPSPKPSHSDEIKTNGRVFFTQKQIINSTGESESSSFRLVGWVSSLSPSSELKFSTTLEQLS